MAPKTLPEKNGNPASNQQSQIDNFRTFRLDLRRVFTYGFPRRLLFYGDLTAISKK